MNCRCKPNTRRSKPRSLRSGSFPFTESRITRVGIQQGDTLADLRQNPIMEEFEASTIENSACSSKNSP